MIYNSNIESDRVKAKVKFDKLMSERKRFDLTEKRTNRQNRALHLLFQFIADELNEIGLTFHYTGLKKVEIETTYTAEIVKEFVWRPIQMTMFKIKSTRDIGTKEINAIFDVLCKFFADRGIEISFPSNYDEYINSLDY